MATLPAGLDDDDDARLPVSAGGFGRGGFFSNDFVAGFGSLPIVRQLGLLIGLAASIALGLSAVLWLREPDMQPIPGTAMIADVGQAGDVLRGQGIGFRMDPSGTLLVDASKIGAAKLALASADMLGERPAGAAGADAQQSFGISQSAEKNQQMHALELDIASTIATMTAVKSARVHIAEPRSTSFLRDQHKPSASVMLQVAAGGHIDRGQVHAIMNLVAFSVPEMQASAVSVVDQRGALLSGQGDDPGAESADLEFQYSRRVEADLLRKIEDILSPTVGAGRFRAQVAADVDFTRREQTAETFDAEQPTLVSEQKRTSQQTGDAAEQGIPGALSNTPPSVAAVPAVAAPAANGAKPQAGAAAAPAPPATAPASATVRSNLEETHNYNSPGRTISTTSHQLGTVRRLTVSVVVDDIPANTAKTGAVTFQPWTEAELERLSVLVKSSIGYDVARGDVVSVINAPFVEIPEPAVVEVPMWTQPWFTNLARDLLIALVVIALGLGVLRPAFRSLSGTGSSAAAAAEFGSGGTSLVNDAQLDAELDQVVSLNSGAHSALASSSGYTQQLDAVRGIIAEDPARVAAVLKSWVAIDE